MMTEPRCVFALVRSVDDLERTDMDIGMFLSMRQRMHPPRPAESLMGIWIDPTMVANTPRELMLHDSPGIAAQAVIHEATGVNDIWMLCWIEIAARAVSRAQLLEALLRASVHPLDRTPPGRFVPVFSHDADTGTVERELRVLESQHRALLLPPRFETHTRDSGRPDVLARSLSLSGELH